MDEAAIKALIAQMLQATVPGLVTQAIGPIGEQLTGITASLAALKPVTPAVAAPPVVVPPVVTPPAHVDPALNSQMLELKRSNEKLVTDMAAIVKQREDADKRADDSERMSIVNTALGGFQFATDAARQTAVEKILPQIKRTDVGTLVAGDNLTPEAFIKDFLPTQHAYLLASVGVGGSGITPGQQQRGGQAVDLDSIKPGMAPEARAAAIQAITVAGAGVFK